MVSDIGILYILKSNNDGYNAYLDSLGSVAGILINTYSDLCDALRNRIDYFDKNGFPLPQNPVASNSFKSMGEISMWDIKSEAVDGDSISFKDLSSWLAPEAFILLDKYKLYGFSA